MSRKIWLCLFVAQSLLILFILLLLLRRIRYLQKGGFGAQLSSSIPTIEELSDSGIVTTGTIVSTSTSIVTTGTINATASETITPIPCGKPPTEFKEWLQAGWLGSAPYERYSVAEQWAARTYAEVFEGASEVEQVGRQGKGQDWRCRKRNFFRVNQICRPYGFGNCLLGLVSVFQLAMLTNSIPLFNQMDPMYISKVWQFRHGPWVKNCLKPCYQEQLERPERWDISWMVPGFFGDVSGYIGSLRQQRGILATITKGVKYYGLEIFMSPKFKNETLKMFPIATINSSAYAFGAFDTAHRAFLQAVPSEVQRPQREIIENRSWIVTGPLITVHVRRGDKKLESASEAEKARAMGVECLQYVISELVPPEARVYIATTKKFAWMRFVDFFDADSEGMARKNAAGRKVQLKAGPAIEEKLSQSNNKQEASPNFFYDWYIIARSDIVIRSSRTTFSSTAAAIGRPPIVYHYHGKTCHPVSFREPCMHDGGHSRQAILKQRREPLFKEYFDYCKSIGEGAICPGCNY